MSEYPPKLVQVTATTFGSLLTLSDGREVPIEVSPDCLNQALLAARSPPLSELLAARSHSVFADTWQTATADWQQISDVVRASPLAATTFRQTPSLWEKLGQPAVLIRDLPHRVYGGLEISLYTSHPFQFVGDPNRSAPWVYALLHASGGRLFKTWVHPVRGQVEIETGTSLGHFLE
jgi:hypothetical protein